MKLSGSYVSAVTLALAIVVLGYAPVTKAQNGDKGRAGRQIWKTSGCADCHGTFADGDRDDDDFPVGANLRETGLDSAALKITIRCGRVGSGMPAFEDGAYTVY